MKLQIYDQTLLLLLEKAIFWLETETLILADIHVGKTVSFQKFGVGIPEGTMEEDLTDIKSLILRLKAKRCIIVGDLIHTHLSLTDDVKKMIADWLKSLPCEMHLVLGNHDKALKKILPNEWSFIVHQELLLEPFYFSHYPLINKPWFTISGHIHPKIEIKNKYDRVVVRCFQMFPDYLILPAFSTFVDGHYVKSQENCRIIAITDSSLIEIN